MFKSRNISIVLIILLLIAFGCIYAYSYQRDIENSKELVQKEVAYNQRKLQKEIEAAKEAQRISAMLETTPGIACWGDGFTVGIGGGNKTYPEELKKLVENGGYHQPVSNMGVVGENSLTVLGRLGAIPFVVKDTFTVSGTEGELNGELAITSRDGEEVSPCIQDYNPGFNPCNVAGMECTIYGATMPGDQSKAIAYYISRMDGQTNDVEIPAGTEIITSGSFYNNYINVLQLGDSGGYDDDDALFAQYESFAEKYGVNDKYIIVGRFLGDAESNAYLDELLTEAYGEHYVNAREILCHTPVEGVEYSDEDIALCQSGTIPLCLKSNGDYLNSKAYSALANMIYERIVELNLMEK